MCITCSEDEGSEEDSDDSRAESDTNDDTQTSADDSRTEESSTNITLENSSISKVGEYFQISCGCNMNFASFSLFYLGYSC